MPPNLAIPRNILSISHPPWFDKTRVLIADRLALPARSPEFHTRGGEWEGEGLVLSVPHIQPHPNLISA